MKLSMLLKMKLSMQIIGHDRSLTFSESDEEEEEEEDDLDLLVTVESESESESESERCSLLFGVNLFFLLVAGASYHCCKNKIEK